MCSAESGSPSQQNPKALTNILAISYQLAACLATFAPMQATGEGMLCEDKKWGLLILAATYMFKVQFHNQCASQWVLGIIPVQQTTQPVFCMKTTTVFPFASAVLYNISFQPSKWDSYQYLKLPEYPRKTDSQIQHLPFLQREGKLQGRKMLSHTCSHAV